MAEYYVGEDVKTLVKELEGFSSTAYADAHGHSIGYGHFIRPEESHLLGKTISREEAEKYLVDDIKEHQKPWIGSLKKDVPGNVITALTSFAYNVGGHSKGLTRAIAAINSGNMDEASKIMSEYNKSYDPKTGTKTENKVLVQRREYEGRLLKGDKVTWGDVRSRSPVEYFKETFGGRPSRAGTAFSTATMGDGECFSTNAAVLQGLRALNRDMRSGAEESRWLQTLKAEGSGLWQAQS
jgi:GH24 family phage-related lysozyme (muramidase)